MKYFHFAFVILLLLFFSTKTVRAYNLFDDIKKAEETLPKGKYNFVYQYRSWCGASRMDFDTLSEILLKHRDVLNFIVITDSVSYTQLSPKLKSVKPDAYLFTDSYFKNRMHDKKDAKELGTQFADRYPGEDINYLGPGTMYIEFPNKNLMKLFNIGNMLVIDKYLESLPICK